ncbi:hypothetical protein FKP32DRAFT_1540771, partial [Trametes sanguinea]
MRIDGSTCPKTYVDEDTGGIVLRRLHPRIASYNDVVIFLMQSNMDIKFIGSGEAAKALLYYVTDYITKPSLPAHVGLSALSYAIQKTNEKLHGAPNQIITAHNDGISDAPSTRGALTLTVNRMLSRQEVSHQQVMSYLVGGGDVYRSHSFRVLHWGSFDRLFANDPSAIVEQEVATDNSPPMQHEEIFTLKMDAGTISAANQKQDYVYRTRNVPFDDMCLYEFVGTVEKVTKRSDQKYTAYDQGNLADEYVPIGDNSGIHTQLHSRGGRVAEARGSFSSAQHTQYSTHHLRRRSEWTVPVILGDRAPRSDRGDEERDRWARMVLILFVPWRVPADILRAGESWIDAYERQRVKISPAYLTIIANMNVLSECRDVRDAHRDLRRKEALAFLRSSLPTNDDNQHTGLDDENMHQEFELYDNAEVYDAYENVEELQLSQQALDAKIGPRCREMVDVCFARNAPSLAEDNEGIRQKNESDLRLLDLHTATMRQLRKQRRPRESDGDSSDDDARPNKRRRILRAENVSRARLPLPVKDTERTAEGMQESMTDQDIVEHVVDTMGLRGNIEQERAFRIIAEHVISGNEQLLMYIAGVGGTGKTHVIQSVVKLFECLGR